MKVRASLFLGGFQQTFEIVALWRQVAGARRATRALYTFANVGVEHPTATE